MAELDAILAKIEAASQEKVRAIHAQVLMESEKEDRETLEEREAWKASETSVLDNQAAIQYQQQRAALEQECKKSLLRDRRKLVNAALAKLPERLRHCSQEEFTQLLQKACVEIAPQESVWVQFGENSPIEQWESWIRAFFQNQYPHLVVEISEGRLSDETGFFLRSNDVGYRLMGQEIIAQFLEENGGELERRLFAENTNGERP